MSAIPNSTHREPSFAGSTPGSPPQASYLSAALKAQAGQAALRNPSTLARPSSPSLEGRTTSMGVDPTELPLSGDEDPQPAVRSATPPTLSDTVLTPGQTDKIAPSVTNLPTTNTSKATDNSSKKIQVIWRRHCANATIATACVLVACAVPILFYSQ